MKKNFYASCCIALLLLTGCKSKNYSFTEKPVILPSDTEGSAGTESLYVSFGDWPQSIKPEKVKVDDRIPIKFGRFTCYPGNDGNYYVKSVVNAYSNTSTYSNGTKPAAGEVQYFKIEPIKWRVLTFNYNNSGKALLLADSILEADIPFYPGTRRRPVGNEEVYTNNYKYSTIRAFLTGTYEPGDPQKTEIGDYTENGYGFLQTAFTPKAQEFICVTRVDNSAASMSYDGNKGDRQLYECEDTYDKVFLPSTLEMVAAGGLGFPFYEKLSSLRIRKTTDYALARGNNQSMNKLNGGWWWLRSPYYMSDYDIRFVSDNGKMTMTDFTYHKITGIVPAICIDILDLKE